ncbi:TonB-dependent receptor [Metapseudomonas otitidis]
MNVFNSQFSITALRRTIVASGVVLYGFVPVVFAGSDDVTELEAVEVVGKRTSPLGGSSNEKSLISNAPASLPASVSTIGAEEIKTINVGRDISNIYRRVPGVVANNIDQGDTGNGFRMRGFATQGTHGADTAVYVDGVPQNIPSSQGGAGHGPVFLEWLTPEMIGEVNVIKGPVSSLYGDQNRAGAVDIQTLDGSQVASSIGVDISSYNGRRTNVVLGGESDGIESLFVGDIYRSDGFRKDNRTERDNYFWKLTKEFNGSKYSARFNHYDSDYRGAGYLYLSDLQAGLSPRSTQFGLPGFGDAKRNTYVFNKAPSDGGEGLYATAYYEDFERSRAIATNTITHTFGKDDRNILGGRVSYNFVVDDIASLMLGAEVRKDKGDAYRQQYRYGSPTENYINDFNMDLITYGVFAQGQYRPINSLKLLAGIRYDRFDYDIENYKYPGVSTGYNSSVTTPKFGVAWTPIDELEVFSNVAQGFRSPAAEQISVGASSALPLGQSGGVANTSIKPTKVKSYDIGFTVRPFSNLSSTTEFFYIQNQDETVQTAPEVYEQVGDTTRKGFDTSLNLQISQAISAYASYGRIIDAVINNPQPGTGAKLTVPEHTYKAGIQYRDSFMSGQLTLNADAYQLSGIPYYVGSPQTQEREMPSYSRYDLRATYDYQQYQVSLYGTFQPHRYGSEIAYGTSSGLLLSPQPSTIVGMSARYFF